MLRALADTAEQQAADSGAPLQASGRAFSVSGGLAGLRSLSIGWGGSPPSRSDGGRVQLATPFVGPADTWPDDKPPVQPPSRVLPPVQPPSRVLPATAQAAPQGLGQGLGRLGRLGGLGGLGAAFRVIATPPTQAPAAPSASPHGAASSAAPQPEHDIHVGISPASPEPQRWAEARVTPQPRARTPVLGGLWAAVRPRPSSPQEGDAVAAPASAFCPDIWPSTPRTAARREAHSPPRPPTGPPTASRGGGEASTPRAAAALEPEAVRSEPTLEPTLSPAVSAAAGDSHGGGDAPQQPGAAALDIPEPPPKIHPEILAQPARLVTTEPPPGTAAGASVALSRVLTPDAARLAALEAALAEAERPCAICLEAPKQKETVLIPCGHSYCERCLDSLPLWTPETTVSSAVKKDHAKGVDAEEGAEPRGGGEVEEAVPSAAKEAAQSQQCCAICRTRWTGTQRLY